MAGTNGYGIYNFYNIFSAGPGGKPFFLSETGVSFYLENQNSDGTWVQATNISAQHRADMKRAWWRQIFNTQMTSLYPKFKGASSFEFAKYEAGNFADFTNMQQWDPGHHGDRFPDPKSNNDLTLAYFKQDLAGSVGSVMRWDP